MRIKYSVLIFTLLLTTNIIRASQIKEYSNTDDVSIPKLRITRYTRISFLNTSKAYFKLQVLK